MNAHFWLLHWGFNYSSRRRSFQGALNLGRSIRAPSANSALQFNEIKLSIRISPSFAGVNIFYPGAIISSTLKALPLNGGIRMQIAAVKIRSDLIGRTSQSLITEPPSAERTSSVAYERRRGRYFMLICKQQVGGRIMPKRRLVNHTTVSIWKSSK